MLVASESRAAAEADVVKKNALIESIALHARNLFEFLCDTDNRDGAMRLEAFGIQPAALEKELRDRLGRLYGYASTRVAHLSWKRLETNPGVPTEDLALMIDLFLDFMASVKHIPLGSEAQDMLDVVRQWRRSAGAAVLRR
ncbi:MAG TPA: hypothetical protein VIM19_09885 [Actinomycetes bacterium]